MNFCRHHGIESIPAKVYVEHYPAAECIQIVDISVAGGRDVCAILDNRYVQKVSHYAHALPLLRAYGVKPLNKQSEGLPSLYTLLQHARECKNDSTFSRAVIDADAVQRRLDKAAQEIVESETFVGCGLLHLPVRRKWIHLAHIYLVLFVAMIVWLNFREGIKGEVALITMVFCSVLLTVMMARVLQIQQKHIEKNLTVRATLS